MFASPQLIGKSLRRALETKAPEGCFSRVFSLVPMHLQTFRDFSSPLRRKRQIKTNRMVSTRIKKWVLKPLWLSTNCGDEKYTFFLCSQSLVK